MFLLGVRFEQGARAATWVILEKTLKNVKKHYQLRAMRQFPSNTPHTEVEDEIIRLYNNREFIVSKRVFSQDRRPAKTVRVHPTIVLDFTDTDTRQADRFRMRKIPTEGVCLCDEAHWRKEDYGPICMGNNYYVTRHLPMQTLLKVFGQKWLIMGNETPLAESLASAMIHLEEQGLTGTSNIIRTKSEAESLEILTVMSLPVWFCETIRSIKRY